MLITVVQTMDYCNYGRPDNRYDSEKITVVNIISRRMVTHSNLESASTHQYFSPSAPRRACSSASRPARLAAATTTTAASRYCGIR